MQPTPSAPTTLPPLVPRKLFFSHPQRSGPQLSPDGQYLTYLAPDERGVQQVWLQGDSGVADRVLTRDPRRGIFSHTWTCLPGCFLYPQDTAGDENVHLHLTDLATGLVRDLTPFQGVRAELIGLHHSRPTEALIALNLADRRFMDVYRVNLTTGAVELDTKNPGNALAYTAHNLEIRAALVASKDGGRDLLLRDSRSSPWRTLRHWGPLDDARLSGFSDDGRTLYLLANHDCDTLRVLALDLATSRETLIAQDPHYDADCLVLHPRTHAPQAVIFVRDKAEWHPLDPAFAADIAELRRHWDGEIHIQSRNLDDTRWIVSFGSSQRMPHYYLYDRAPRKLSFLFAANPPLDAIQLPPKQPIQLTSRDGLTLHGFLTQPLGKRPPAGWPTILCVHGGPWMRDGWGFWSTYQWLANRGYAVLQVNFRGSTGYGKAFLNAGNRQWAANMHNDLIDTVNWAIAQGIADQKRVAIFGASYGGYSVLVGLTFTPDVFACGVDLVGPANLVTLLNTTPPWWESMRAILDLRVGNPQKDVEYLKSRSPVFFAHRIQRPLLIGQGANDVRVKQDESDQIVAAMRQANLPVEYVIYTDEGHTLARPENRMHFHALAENFLAKHLGGRAEPLGDLKGHSARLA